MRVFVSFVVSMAVIAVSAGRVSGDEILGVSVPNATENAPFPPETEQFVPGAVCHRGCLRCLCCGLHGSYCDGSCGCHGSYKYPVPSQYTYFWPGIYSQPTMTQYVSPWRYPDLKPIPEYWKFETPTDNSPYSGYRY